MTSSPSEPLEERSVHDIQKDAALLTETEKALDAIEEEQHRLSRRSFLSAVGLGALGLALPYVGQIPELDTTRSLDSIEGRIVGDDFSLAHRWRDKQLSFKPTPPTRTHDVVIVGGGVAGLASAWRLHKAGCKDFVVLERSPHMGGIAHAGRVGNRAFPWGAHYVDPPDRENKALCRIYEDLGVLLGYHPVDKRPICNPKYIVKPPHRNILAGGRWMRGLIPWNLATDYDRRCFEAFGEEMEAWSAFRDKQGRRAFGFPIDQCSSQVTIRRLDSISMLSYLRHKEWNSRLLHWLVNDRCIDEFSLPIGKISAWAGIQYFASLPPLQKIKPAQGFPHDPRIDSIDPTDQKMSWPEGNAFLVKGLLRELPSDRLHNEKMVVHIQNVGEGAHVTYVDAKTLQAETIRARYVIYAAPKYTVYHCIPDLRAVRKEFSDVLYVPWIVGSVQCRQAPQFPGNFSMAWENNRFQSWSQGYINPQHHTEPMLAQTQGPLKEPMVLSFYACLAYQPDVERKELYHEGWDFWARQMLDELERMHPQMGRHVERLDIFRWGHAMHAPRPGFLFGGVREAIRKPYGRIFFSQADTAGLAVFEQVSVRGIEVAEDIMKALQHPFQSYM